MNTIVGGQHKITAKHRQRLACVYIRQSSLKQVKHNLESQALQYRLAERAQALSWKRERVRVIDQDQGVSGRASHNRDGFKELLGELSLGRVGIIFSYQVSRLARNNSDWYHLLDLAAIFDTLIADEDGIYDLRQYNDRLLLGLKGTMSEAELHFLQQRLQEGRLNQVRQGKYRQGLPTGLVRLADGSVIKDPDEQVRHTIELVLTKFEELGSALQVLRHLCREQVLLPRRQGSGPYKGQIMWKPPAYGAILSIIHNPAYAGAFAHGRRQTDPSRHYLGRGNPNPIYRPMSEWTHLQQDVYPAYITWEQYLANQERLHQNETRFKEQMQRPQGVAREGAALLQGLATCGYCGARMRVMYKAHHRYACHALVHKFGQPVCASLHGPAIDEQVVGAFFEALRPAQLDALAAILADQQAERERQERQWQERLKRARYEAELAQRQYNAVDPDNRLVAAELERRWEEKLRQLQSTEEAYERFEQSPALTGLSPELREQLQHISERLPELWYAGQLTNGHKKELLRSLINRVILKRASPDTVEVKIVWVSGHYSLVYARPPVRRRQDLGRYEEMVERIGELWRQGLGDPQIAEQLTAEDFRSAMTPAEVLPSTVRKIRHEQRWCHRLPRSRQTLELKGQLTTGDLAALLGVTRSWVYRRLRRGQIDPRYVTRHGENGIYLIKNEPELIEQLKQLL